jgi:hypothetical protein
LNSLLIGLAIIIIPLLLLILLGVVFRRYSIYAVRSFPALKALIRHRTSAVEQGLYRHLVSGFGLSDGGYLGLGLHALHALPLFIQPEDLVDGLQKIESADGSLMLLTQQLLNGNYSQGYYQRLKSASAALIPGITPLSFTAGLLTELHQHKPGSIAIFGEYGASSALWAACTMDHQGHVFAAAGSLAAQAALFLSVRDLLIGEEIFATKPVLKPTPFNLASLQTEDVLRVVLIFVLILASLLKLFGFL